MKKSKEEREVVLSVRHLKQYFKFGKGANKYNKAVHDVSFDVHKGEVFGLVGESGCGKTTTGRSIIKLYDITSGSIYFKGYRVCAGTRWNEKEIKWKKKKAKIEIDEILEKKKEVLEEALNECSDDKAIEETKARINEEYDGKIAEIRKNLDEIVDEQMKKIRSAKYDHKHCNHAYAKEQVAKVKEEYRPKLLKFKEKGSIKGNLKEYLKLRYNYFKDVRFARKDKIMTKMQMIFQDPIASLNPRMTVREIISEGLRIRGIKDKAVIESKVNEVLTLVGLVPEHATRYPHEFSGGQRQRIGIARALIMNPELIIADEPISALDVSIQAQVINLLNDLKETLGLTILFVAHDLSVVKYFCDRIAVMYFGKIVETASSEELFKNPLHPYTRSLLSAIPLPDPHYEKNRKRISYVPSRDHDYSKQGPKLQEVKSDHFVYCNDEELAKYKKMLKK